MPTGGRIFAFFCSPRDHRPQNSGCVYTARSFHTGWTQTGHVPTSVCSLEQAGPKVQDGQKNHLGREITLCLSILVPFARSEIRLVRSRDAKVLIAMESKRVF